MHRAKPLLEPVIETRRLRLRPIRAGDAEPIFAIFADWRVIQYLSMPPWPYRSEDAEDFVRSCLKKEPDRLETAFMITRDGIVMGGIGYRMREPGHTQKGAGPNIGYWLGCDHWGFGYMTEALEAMVRHIFKTINTPALYCGAFAENAASLRVQEKIGFEREGETMVLSRPRGGEYPHINTVLNRDRFEAPTA